MDCRGSEWEKDTTLEAICSIPVKNDDDLDWVYSRRGRLCILEVESTEFIDGLGMYYE